MIEYKFKNASEAFDFYYGVIPYEGIDFAGTKAMFNQGFLIEKPWLRIINNEKRNWKFAYAQAEWEWYLTTDRKVSRLGQIYCKVPAIWERMADAKREVRSNYGWQWQRRDHAELSQLDYVVEKLKNKNTRQATISIYDGKEHERYEKDTPCTYAIQFTILNNRLDMCVTMRSNDLWYGFCNDQYCFSKLQKMVSNELNIEPGVYYHFAHNMHLYNDKI